MEVSIYLAKVIGLYLIITAIAILINNQKIKPIMADFVRTPALMFITGFICLVLGLLLVVGHNIWVADWRVLITLIGWLTLLKGATRFAWPQWDSKMVTYFIENKNPIYIAAIINLVIGLYLAYVGFTS